MIRPTFLGVGGCVGYRLFWREETWTKISASIIDMVDIQRKNCLPTLAARGLEEHMRVFLIFAITVSFMLFAVFTLANVLYFEEFLIHDSRGFLILKNN
jgi:hypothetical protein